MKLTELQEKLGERMVNICREDLTEEELAREIERSKAAATLGREMVRNANTIINAKKAVGAITTEFVDKFI